MDYTIQYSHDGSHWFGFGADAVKSPNQYTLDAAHQQLTQIRDSYAGVMRWARIIDPDGQEIRKVLVGAREPMHATNGQLEIGPSLASVWWPDATDQAKLDACAAHWQCSAASLTVAVKRGSLLAFDTLGITVEQADLDDCTRNGVYDPRALLAMLYARVT